MDSREIRQCPYRTSKNEADDEIHKTSTEKQEELNIQRVAYTQQSHKITNRADVGAPL